MKKSPNFFDQFHGLYDMQQEMPLSREKKPIRAIAVLNWLPKWPPGNMKKPAEPLAMRVSS
jgi:hypothetical protein